MMTIFTVLIAVVSLLVFGGPVTFGFALATTLGADRRHLLLDLGGDARSCSGSGSSATGVRGPGEAGTQFGKAGGLRVRTTEVDFEGRLPVDGYGAGGFRVAGAVHRGPLALVPAGVVAWAGLPDLAPFLERVAELRRSAGRDRRGARGRCRRRSPRRAAQLEAAGAGVEVMATPSACRTYNVLLAEGRRVAAALMPI